MDFNFNFGGFSEKSLNSFLTKLDILDKQMATFQEILQATREQQDIIKSVLFSTEALMKEVRQLLAQNDIAGADALLAEIEANSQALFNANVENTEATVRIDEINGDPVV